MTGLKMHKITFDNPNFSSLGYIDAVANLKDKHDRSAPSDYHWKILKCRMIIFSSSSIMGSPDKTELKRIHIIFNKIGDDYDKLNSLFSKFSLTQAGEIKQVVPEMFQLCFQYTMTAKMAPVWNTVGYNYLINNRDFMVTTGQQDGIKYSISSEEGTTTMEIQAVKLNLLIKKETFTPGEWIRVLPSLNKATIEEFHENMPKTTNFRSYKDLRRHWKNIHGYRLPEVESSYYTVRFWRGEPLTYPKMCVLREFPIVTPVPKQIENSIIKTFLSYLKYKMPLVLGFPLNMNNISTYNRKTPCDIKESQAVSLCSPTQAKLRKE